jgi:hypothetical protein
MKHERRLKGKDVGFIFKFVHTVQNDEVSDTTGDE